MFSLREPAFLVALLVGILLISNLGESWGSVSNLTRTNNPSPKPYDECDKASKLVLVTNYQSSLVQSVTNLVHRKQD